MFPSDVSQLFSASLLDQVFFSTLHSLCDWRRPTLGWWMALLDFFSLRPLSERSLKPHLSRFRLRVTMFAVSDRVDDARGFCQSHFWIHFRVFQSGLYLSNLQPAPRVHPHCSKPNLRCARRMTVITSAQIRRFMRRITERFAQKRFPLRGNQLSFFSGTIQWLEISPNMWENVKPEISEEKVVIDGDI